jgi:hypothetical protein
MAMLGDGIQSYDNSKDGSDTELAGCEVIKLKKLLHLILIDLKG